MELESSSTMELESSTTDAHPAPSSRDDVDALIKAIDLQPNSVQLDNLKQIVARLRAEAADEPVSPDADSAARARKIADAGRALWNKGQRLLRDANAVHSELECDLRSVAQEILAHALLVDTSLDVKAFLVRCAESSEAWMDLADGAKDEAVQTYCAKAAASLALHDVALSKRGDCNAGAMVDILLAKSRMHFILGNMDESFRVIELAREKIETTQTDKAEQLAARVFHFGRERLEHSDAIAWLELSVDVQQKIRLQGNHTGSEVSDRKLSATYLILAHCFLVRSRYETCEVAAKKAEALHTSVASASLLLQCNIAQGKTLEASVHLNTLITHAEIADNVPLACQSLKIASSAGLDTEPSVKALLTHPMIGPEGRLPVRVFQLESAVAGTSELKSLASICGDIREHHTNNPVLAKPDNAITIALLQRIQRSMKQWDDEEASSQAVDDTHLCCQELMKFDFVTPEQANCIARMLCYASLRKNDLAGSDQYLQTVMAADPSSLFTQVLRWKHSLQSKQVSESKDALRQIVQLEHDDKHGLLVSMANSALENGQHEIYLQCLQEQFWLGSGSGQQRVALLVDMVRVGEQLGTIVSMNLLKSLTDVDMKMVKSEADKLSLQYLFNTFWNLGLKASKAVEYKSCADCFLRCASLSDVEQPEGLSNTKMLLMLGADALVLHSKQRWQHHGSEQTQEIVADIERALACIQRCRSLMMRPVPSVDDSERKEDRGLPSLAVVECRARCLLIDATNTDDTDALTSVLNAADQLESITPKFFVQIYEIFSKSAVQHPELACRAIKCALGLSLQKQSKAAGMLPQAYDESAVLIRQLIEATKQAKQMDECLAMVNTARDHIAESEGGYPLIEVEWLVCTAWNEGVKRANDGDCAAADPWMSAAVGMLTFLPTSTFSDKKRNEMQAELSDVLRKREV